MISLRKTPDFSKNVNGEKVIMTKQERFQKIATIRTQRVLDAMVQLSHCSKPASYEYTDEQVEQIISALEKGVSQVRETFQGKNRFRLTRED